MQTQEITAQVVKASSEYFAGFTEAPDLQTFALSDTIALYVRQSTTLGTFAWMLLDEETGDAWTEDAFYPTFPAAYIAGLAAADTKGFAVMAEV